MSYADNPYQSPLGTFAAQAGADQRSDFITKTYLHLAGAIGLFVVLEAVLLHMPGIEGLVQMMVAGYGWLVVLGLFMVVSYVAQNWAQSAVSPGTQYLGLGLYVVAEAVIFVPLLYIAGRKIPGSFSPPAWQRSCSLPDSPPSSSLPERTFPFCGPGCCLAGWRRSA